MAKRSKLKRQNHRRQPRIHYKQCPHCGFITQGTELEVLLTTICPCCYSPLSSDMPTKEKPDNSP